MRLLYAVLIVLLVISCKKNNDTDNKFRHWPVVKVEGASNGTKNQVIPITVYWPYTSGSCDVLSKFETSRKGSIIEIIALGYSSGGICTMDTGIKTKIYEFTSSSAGTFELRFMNRDNTYLSHTVVIN
jgi:hypothetical protein